jgi:cytoskeletal protein CcmA (bactofilin family)
MPKRAPSVLSFGSRILDAVHYGTIRSFGDLNTTGDLSATRMRAFGDSEIQGRCSVKHLFTAGNVQIHESLRTESLRSFGNVIVHGQLTAAQLRIFGDLSATGRVNCHQIKLWGDAHLSENLVAETVKLTGSCRIDGLVSAERIQIRSRGSCEINEIGGTTITIRAGWNEDGCAQDKSFLNWRCKGTTRVQLIEGDCIYLENTTADIVRGQTVTLGRGCRIAALEYGEKLSQHPSSEVGCARRIAPSEDQRQHAHPTGGHDE